MCKANAVVNNWTLENLEVNIIKYIFIKVPFPKD